MCKNHFSPPVGLVLLYVLASVFPAAISSADVPQMINYQGRLTDNIGDPIGDGTYAMTLRIWDDSISGNMLWSEVHPSVTTTNGLFSVLLGSVDSLNPEIFEPTAGDVSDSKVRFLEIQIGIDPPIAPRTRIASAAYSLVAHRLRGDVSTSRGKMELLNLGGGGQYATSMIVDSGEVQLNMEANDGISVTKYMDKSSPNLMMATKKKKSAAGDSSYVTLQIDEGGIQRVLVVDDDILTDRLTENVTLNGSGMAAIRNMKYKGGFQEPDSSIAMMSVDSSGAWSMLESTDGVSLTKYLDKSSPNLMMATKKKKSAAGDSSYVTLQIDEEGIQRVLVVDDDILTDRLTENVTLNGSGMAAIRNMKVKGGFQEPDSSIAMMTVDSGGACTMLESTDGVSITTKMDKATPQLMLALKKKKSSATDSTLAVTQIDDVGYERRAELDDGSYAIVLDERIEDRLGDWSLMCEEKGVRAAGDSSMVAARADTGEAVLSVEYSTAERLRKAVKKATPLYASWTIEASEKMKGDSSVITAEIDTLEAVIEMEYSSTERLTKALKKIAKSYAGWNLQCNEKAKGDSVLAKAEVDTAEAYVSVLRDGSTGYHGVSLSAGSDSAKLQIFKNALAEPEPSGPPANIIIAGKDHGGYIEITNIGGTEGDGMDWDCDASMNYMQIRHGGANSGVYMVASSMSGGRIGINNESPDEALQVSGNICASGTIGVCSDIRFKKNIRPISMPLEIIRKLQPVNFDWRVEEYPEQRFSDKPQIGFIAQEVIDYLPEVVSSGNSGYYSIDYGKLTPLLVEAVKQQQKTIEDLQNQINELKEIVKGLNIE